MPITPITRRCARSIDQFFLLISTAKIHSSTISCRRLYNFENCSNCAIAGKKRFAIEWRISTNWNWKFFTVFDGTDFPCEFTWIRSVNTLYCAIGAISAMKQFVFSSLLQISKNGNRLFVLKFREEFAYFSLRVILIHPVWLLRLTRGTLVHDFRLIA